jgi:RLL motif-containing protein 1
MYEWGVVSCAADPVLAQAVRVLRLLHIAELRDLQTLVNESIVSVQQYTFNPRVDTKLGEVGQ